MCRTIVYNLKSFSLNKADHKQLAYTKFIMSQQKLKPTFDDVMGCQTAVYEWADSYDSKVHHLLSSFSMALITISNRIGTACASASPQH